MTPFAVPRHDEDAWSGGDYDLSIDLGRRSGADLDAAIRALWGHASLLGVWEDRTAEWLPANQADAGLPDLDSQQHHAYGVATLRDGARVICATYIYRADADPDGLCLSIPVSSLASVYQLDAYPFNAEDTSAWEIALSEWMADVARSVYERVRFSQALTGYEGWTTADETADGPDDRRFGHLQGNGDRLDWYPPTRWEGPARI